MYKSPDSDGPFSLLVLNLPLSPILTVRLIFFCFVSLLVQFRWEDFGTSGQYNQTSAGRDWSQDLCAGQRIHERQIQGKMLFTLTLRHTHLAGGTCEKGTSSYNTSGLCLRGMAGREPRWPKLLRKHTLTIAKTRASTHRTSVLGLFRIAR